MDLSILESPVMLIDEYDLLSQDIYVLLNTVQGAIPFDFDFGVSLYKYVHEFNADEKEIRSHIISQIKKYCKGAENYSISVDIAFFQQNYSDVCLIDILIDARKVFGLLI